MLSAAIPIGLTSLKMAGGRPRSGRKKVAEIREMARS
jgi:hypothetical protein